MSDNETYVPTTTNRRLVRSSSFDTPEDQTNVDESVNLLGGDRDQSMEVGGDTPRGGGQGQSVSFAIKRALQPLMAELKMVKKQNVALDKKMTTFIQKSELQEKLLKEIGARLNKVNI